MNATTHGLRATRTILAGESAAEFEKTLAGWAQLVRPTSHPEADITAQLADVSFRLARLDVHEQELLAAAADRQIEGGPAAQRLQVAQNLLQVADLLVEQLQAVGEIHVEDMTALTNTIQLFAASAQAITLPSKSQTAFETAARALHEEALLGAHSSVAAAVIDAAKVVVDDARKMLPMLEQEEQQERQNALPGPLVVDDKVLKRLHVYRTRLLSLQERLLGILRQVRELPPPTEEGHVTAFEVTLRVVGRPR